MYLEFLPPTRLRYLAMDPNKVSDLRVVGSNPTSIIRNKWTVGSIVGKLDPRLEGNCFKSHPLIQKLKPRLGKVTAKPVFNASKFSKVIRKINLTRVVHPTPHVLTTVAVVKKTQNYETKFLGRFWGDEGFYLNLGKGGKIFSQSAENHQNICFARGWLYVM